jgi:HAE1 family hydrophobic/amphiphilic exporter-1
MPLSQALVESARLRFRPIIMTTMTVLVISFPLILGRGEGSEYAQGLGVVILGGILFSAILTFFVVPSAFYLFERGRPVPQPSPAPQGPTPTPSPSAAD